MGASLVASSWLNSFGSSWGNSWGPITVDVPNGGGHLKRRTPPKNIIAYLKNRDRIAQSQILETASYFEDEEIKTQVEEIRDEYEEYLELLNRIPVYETEMFNIELDIFIKTVDQKIALLKQTLDKQGFDVDLIIALLASDMDAMEIALVIATL